MSLSRIDLADATSPERLVQEILRHEPTLTIPVPIEELCLKLDIVDITALETDGYEGGLLTSADKFNGSILYNKNSPRQRRRFTIAHELAHFLLASHVPSEDGKFLCSMKDMLALSGGEGDRRLRMEVEANRFAASMLLPPPFFRVDVGAAGGPDLQHLVQLARKYDVSKEACSRSYVRFREEPVAVVITRNSKVLRAYRDPVRFGSISAAAGRPVPTHSLLRRRKHEEGVPSDIDETDAGVWLDNPRGGKLPQLYEQVLLQRDGFAMIMLSIEDNADEDEDDAEADMTAAQRLKRRLSGR